MGIVTENYLAWALDGLGVVPIVMKPAATLVDSFSYDKKIVEDEGVTWPGYTTTATTLLASSAISTTVTLDFENYSYLVIERMLSIPTYSVSTIGKGRVEYNIVVTSYEIVDSKAGQYTALVDTTKKTAADVRTIVVTGTIGRLLYYSNATNLAAYATASYGCYLTPTAPSLSGSTLTLNTPVLATRGSTSYFTTTYMSAVTDVRYQWVIEVWKCPLLSTEISNGWTPSNDLIKVRDCVDSSTHKLL